MLFGAIAIDKCKCHYPKNPIYTDEVDIGKILISNKVSFGKTGYKYFTGYKNNDKVNWLHLTLPKIIGCGKKQTDEDKHVFIN